ncbi:MAG: hypothetical protein ACLUYV_04215 [Alistipes shahii]
MQITLSFATTADGYLDDNSPGGDDLDARRLGGGPAPSGLARRDPRREPKRCGATIPPCSCAMPRRSELRRARGMRPDLTKVTLTHSGRLAVDALLHGGRRRPLRVFRKGTSGIERRCGGYFKRRFNYGFSDRHRTRKARRGASAGRGEPPSCACSSPKGWPTRCAGRSIRS